MRMVYVTIGTFSENGPDKCSSLNVKQYSEEALTNELKTVSKNKMHI